MIFDLHAAAKKFFAETPNNYGPCGVVPDETTAHQTWEEVDKCGVTGVSKSSRRGPSRDRRAVGGTYAGADGAAGRSRSGEVRERASYG